MFNKLESTGKKTFCDCIFYSISIDRTSDELSRRVPFRESGVLTGVPHWTPEGKRKRGRPKTTRRRTVEAEMKNMNHSWGTIQRLASDRQGWRSFAAALNASWRDG